MNLRRSSKSTATKLILEHDPVPGATGFRLSHSLTDKRPHTWDGTRTEHSFPVNAEWYKVEALGVTDSGTFPPPVQPPPPPVDPLPAIVTKGGVYSGERSSVVIQTAEPVSIIDSLLVGTGPNIVTASGADVTFERTTFRGPRAPSPGSNAGRAVYAHRIKSLVMQNCMIENTTGLRFDDASPGARILVARNKVRDIQILDHNSCFFQVANVSAVIEVAWNEVINLFGQCGVEDNISLYASHGARIHDNYIQGSFPWKPTTAASGPHSGSGIMTGDAAGSDHEVWNNIVVGTTNCGIGVAGGSNIKIHDNRMVCWGRLPDGTPLAATNVGLAIFGSLGPGVEAWANVIGWLRPDGVRADSWAAGGSLHDNISLPNPITYESEKAEHVRWLERVAAAGIRVGI